MSEVKREIDDWVICRGDVMTLEACDRASENAEEGSMIEARAFFVLERGP